ncbi:transglycosylase domain-containing protein [Desulfuribacillus alkaliarsenatis]|uniref:Glycosyl transferase family 51 domain-containing protein n=1 Tax=Desulfuribacillus alkaliarsenatis TaxID=766136 RepID=A0A1E5G418_9FIRM|nr:biosynthetic peptidoglycan transglycosylase [Desulfuribacillus alkaliarsenatis]OEF97831.1 hypothetical protein BHF68_13445 [Desulfuribacillus alkaliarsenatis]
MIRALWNLIAVIVKLALILFGLFITYHLVTVGFYLVTTPQLLKADLLEITEGETQTITYIEEKPVANKQEFRIQYVTQEEIAETFLWSVVAIEDERFRQHGGVDYYAIVRASYNNLLAREYMQGGSTITQQLAKNLYLSPDKRFSRKLVEVYFAKRLEARFTKDEILEMYVNQIYYGQGMYGIERAAEHFFGKQAIELDIAEAAFLAGILQAPSVYSNPANLELALQRQYTVLERLVEQNYISQDQATKALEIFVLTEH